MVKPSAASIEALRADESPKTPQMWELITDTSTPAGAPMNASPTSSTASRLTAPFPVAPTVLAVGAAGVFAGLVVPELVKRGAHVRGLIQRPEQDAAVREQGAGETAVGDLRDRASMDAALEGVDAVFYIAPAFIDDEAEIGKSMVAAAVEAGVRRFVFSSVIDPSIGALVNHSAKAPVEEAIIESGMEYVLLQPTLFVQGIARSWPTVVETGVFAEPWSTETRFTRVDYRDVAEVAAIALIEDRLLYGTYQLCAEGNLNRHEVAELMGDVLGTRIEARRVSLSEGNGTGQASPLTDMFDWYDKRGLLGNALVLRAILGREPRTLKAYIEELAAATPTDNGSPAMDAAPTAAPPSSALPDDDPKRELGTARPDDDQTLEHWGLVGDTYTTLLGGEDTAGRYTLIDMLVPRGGGPPPHRHDFEEMFTVLEGEVEVTFRGVKQTARAGQTVNIPANAPHVFTNACEHPARLLCMCSPPGQEKFFAEVGTPVSSRTEAPPKLDEAAEKAFIAKSVALSPKYRTELLLP